MAKPVLHVALEFKLEGDFQHPVPRKNPKSALPLYLSSHGLCGCISLKYNEAALPIRSKDIVKVTLNGSYLVRRPGGGSDRVLDSSYFRLSFLDLTDVSRVIRGKFSADEWQIGFSFIIPSVVSHLTSSSESQTLSDRDYLSQETSLPSSLATGPILVSDPDANIAKVYAEIIYTLRAQVFRRNIQIGDTTQKILLYNDKDVQPPMYNSDISTEYRCFQEKPLRKHLRKTGVSLTATLTEPAPCIFRSKEDSPSTILPVEMKVCLRSQQDNIGRPEMLEQILTSISTTRLSGRSDPVNIISTVGPKNRLKWQLPICRESEMGNQEFLDNSWTETVKLPIFLEKSAIPTPSVSTPFMCRKYNLVLWIDLTGPRSGKTSLQLEVPVQMVYQGEKTALGSVEQPPYYEDWEDSPEHTCTAREVPIYSP